MKTQILFFFLILNSIIAFSQQKPFKDELIDSTINAFKTKWSIPGISVAIAKDGKLIYAKGFGYADTLTKELVTVYSLFRIASCSKTITAIGIMKLIQDKKLHIDDTVFGNKGILNDTAYLHFSDKRIKNITIKNLLQQTIGWHNEDVVGANDASYALKTACPSTPTDIIRFNLQKDLDFAPSADFRYCNINYLLLGEIVKKVTGQSYETYITKEILNPAGVYTAKLGKTKIEDKLKNEVHYYDINSQLQPSVFDTTKLVPSSYGSFYLESMYASGGWVTRPIDLVKIILAVDGNNIPPDILNQETIKLMTTLPENIKSHYAMGWEVDGHKWCHSGALTWGSSALICKNINGLCYAITCNNLSTKKGSDEEMYKAMVEYMKELYGFLPGVFKNITSYPDIDLFDKYK